MAAYRFSKRLGSSVFASLSLLGAAIGALPVSAQEQAVPVTWVNSKNVTISGNTITEACNGCGDAGAESQQTLTSGDGGFEFVVGNKEIFGVGIGSGAPSTNIDGIEYALRFNGAGSAEVRENGRHLKDIKYNAGDRFRIAVEAGAVNFYKNDGGKLALVHSIKNPASLQYPIKIEAVLLGPQTSVSQAVAKRAAGAAAPVVSDSKLTWTNLANAKVEGNTLIGGSANQDAGGQSVETLTGDGFVEFTAVETDKMRAIGLDNHNDSNNFDDIDFAIVLRQASAPGAKASAEIWESGTFISDTAYSAGDRFRIAIEQGVVKYYQYVKGSPVELRGRHSKVQNYPVHVDAAFYDLQSTLADVKGGRLN